MEEDFYKISNSTGLTIGKLKNRDVNVRAKIKENIVTLMHHAEVEWIKNPNNNNQTPLFSAYGDCDSLCCVRRGSFFVPFAIHCGANSFVSYGCSLERALPYLGFEYDDLELVIPRFTKEFVVCSTSSG